MGLSTLRHEGALFLGNSLTGDTLGEFPTHGRISCLIPRCTILPGRYSLNIHATINGQLADWIVDAVSIDVTEGDYFGTGRLPPSGYGSTAAEHHWSIASS